MVMGVMMMRDRIMIKDRVEHGAAIGIEAGVEVAIKASPQPKGCMFPPLRARELPQVTIKPRFKAAQPHEFPPERFCSFARLEASAAFEPKECIFQPHWKCLEPLSSRYSSDTKPL